MKRMPFFFMLASLMLAACSSDNATEPGDNNSQIQPGANPDWALTTRLDLTSDEEEDMKVMNEFSHRFMAEAQAVSDDGSFCVSPLSVSVYLGMLANATSGDVHNEIMAALGVDDINALNSLNEKLMHYLPCDENGSSIAIANRFWVKNTLKIADSFISTASNVFNAGVEYVDFTKSTTVPAINKWVSDNTKGKIPTLLDGNWEKYANLAMASANTVYFKGHWDAMFNPENSVKDTFHGLAGDSKTTMMHNTVAARYADNGKVKALILDFQGGANAMELYLPAEGIDIKGLASSLTSDARAALLSAMQTYEVALSLPSFENYSETELPKVLGRMGVRSLKNADFSPMGLDAMEASLIHKTSVKIDEEGAELAAVAGGTVSTAAPDTEYKKVSVDFNRPFLYIVRNTKTGAILMAGTVTNL